MLIAACLHRGDGMKWQAKPFRGSCSNHGSTIANGYYPCKRTFTRDPQRGFFNLAEANRDGMVPPWVVHDVAAVGGQNGREVKPPRRIGKRARLVSRSGRNDQ